MKKSSINTCKYHTFTMAATGPRVCILWAGGGLAGAIPLGALHYFFSEHPSAHVSTMAGVSIGALATGLFAYRPATETNVQTIDRLYAIMKRCVGTSCIFGVPNPFALCCASSLLSIDHIKDVMNKSMLERNRRQDIECIVWTTNARKRHPESKSNIGTTSEEFKRHMIASASIPFLFPSVSINSQPHVDGGCEHMVPPIPPRVVNNEWDYIIICCCHPLSMPDAGELRSGIDFLQSFISEEIVESVRRDVIQIWNQIKSVRDDRVGLPTKVLLIAPESSTDSSLQETSVGELRRMYEAGEQLMRDAIKISDEYGNVHDTWLGKQDVRRDVWSVPAAARAQPDQWNW